jgi:hypothetical protein
METPGVCPQELQETGAGKEARQQLPRALGPEKENQCIATNAASSGIKMPCPANASAGNTGVTLRSSEIEQSCLDGLEVGKVPEVEAGDSSLHEATSHSTLTGLSPGLRDTVGLDHQPANHLTSHMAR